MCAFDFLFGCPRRRRRRRNPRSLFTSNFPRRSDQYIPGHVPMYQIISDRDFCPLLQACWEQDWTRVSERCRSHPHEAFIQSAPTLRTALHFATIPGAKCPFTVLCALIETNPHAVLVRDHGNQNQHLYRPLDFACENAFLRGHAASIKLLVDTAVRVEEELLAATTCTSAGAVFVRFSHESPLVLAVKWAAPAQTLDILVQASAAAGRRQSWIAPWTGGESRLQILRNRVSSSSSSSNSSSGLSGVVGRFAAGCDSASPLQILWSTVAYRFDVDDDAKLSNNIDLLPMMRIVAEILLEDVNHFPFLSGIPSSSSLVPAAATGKNSSGSSSSSSLHDQDHDADFLLVIEDWIKLVVLLRHHVATSSGTLLSAVAMLHRPIPGLVRLVCRVFPESLLQSVPLPRHQQQHHHKQQQQKQSNPISIMNNTHKDEDDAGAVVKSLHSSKSKEEKVPWSKEDKEENEHKEKEEQEVLLLYPVILAAIQHAKIDIIFHLLVSAPQALEMQRQQAFIVS